ncbi:hypothetical protein VTI74DRAFT_831 [Chaetomium olivicolor]
MVSADPAYLPLSNGNPSRRSSHEEDCDPVLESKPSLLERSVSWYQITVIFAIAFVFGAMSSKLVTFAASFVSSGNENKLKELVDLPIETVYFRMNESFMQDTSEDSDRLWQSLIPGLGDANGKVAVDYPERYGLQPGIPSGPHTQNYCVSMFHSLHCLITIRDIFYGLLQGRYNASDYGRHDENGHFTELTVRIKGHTSHCFDYIRQEIQCCGDMTLEGPPRSETGFLGQGQEGTPHLACKSFSAAVEFMKAHQPAERFT